MLVVDGLLQRLGNLVELLVVQVGDHSVFALFRLRHVQHRFARLEILLEDHCLTRRDDEGARGDDAVALSRALQHIQVLGMQRVNNLPHHAHVVAPRQTDDKRRLPGEITPSNTRRAALAVARDAKFLRHVALQHMSKGDGRDHRGPQQSPNHDGVAYFGQLLLGKRLICNEISKLPPRHHRNANHPALSANKYARAELA
mmetsp:Transcript_25745/g.43192  ORF Transcript_25745/g.43192 Transcript_25745/m.43192 type:complete len:200 (-) Transcript_25745:1217-1816(-)